MVFFVLEIKQAKRRAFDFAFPFRVRSNGVRAAAVAAPSQPTCGAPEGAQGMPAAWRYCLIRFERIRRLALSLSVLPQRSHSVRGCALRRPWKSRFSPRHSCTSNLVSCHVVWHRLNVPIRIPDAAVRTSVLNSKEGTRK